MPEYANNSQVTNMINAFIDQYNQLKIQYPTKKTVLLDEKGQIVSDVKKISSDLIQLTLSGETPLFRFIHPNQFDLTLRVSE